MALFNIRILSEEERERRKIEAEMAKQKAEQLKYMSTALAQTVGTQIADFASQSEQEIAKEQIKMQAYLKRLMDAKVAPDRIQKVVGDYNQKVYNKWLAWKQQIDGQKKIFQKLGQEEAVQTLDQIAQYQPFVFYNFEPTADGNFVVQEINPEGTVLNTFQFKSPEDYATFVSANPEVAMMEKATTPAQTLELEKTAALLGKTPQQLYEERTWLAQQRLKPSEQRMVEFIAATKNIPLDQALEEYKGYKLNIDLTAAQKNYNFVSKMAMNAIDAYNKAVPEELRVEPAQDNPLVSFLDMDLSQIKDKKLRSKIESYQETAVQSWLKLFNPQGYSAAVKQMKEVNRFITSMARAANALQMKEINKESDINFFKKWLYDYVGKYIPLEQIPGLDKLLSTHDIDLIKNFQFTANMVLKMLSGTAVSANEWQRFITGVASLAEHDPNIIRGLLNIAQMSLSELDSVKQNIGEVPFMAKYGRSYLWANRTVETLQKILESKGIEVSPTVSLSDAPAGYFDTGAEKEKKGIPVKAFTKKPVSGDKKVQKVREQKAPVLEISDGWGI